MVWLVCPPQAEDLPFGRSFISGNKRSPPSERAAGWVTPPGLSPLCRSPPPAHCPSPSPLLRTMSMYAIAGTQEKGQTDRQPPRRSRADVSRPGVCQSVRRVRNSSTALSLNYLSTTRCRPTNPRPRYQRLNKAAAVQTRQEGGRAGQASRQAEDGQPETLPVLYIVGLLRGLRWLPPVRRRERVHHHGII